MGELISEQIAQEQYWSLAMMSVSQARNDFGPVGKTRYSFSFARNALYHSLKLLGISPGEHVLVPAYVCRAAIDPLLAYGVNVDFYALTRDCAPDIGDIERRIAPLTKAILLVHYFGFPQTVGPIRSLCNMRNLMLIEDCAHVLCGERDGVPMGVQGDAAVFSWRKFLPISDGADLLMNRQGPTMEIDRPVEGPWCTVKSALNLMERSLSYSRLAPLGVAFRCMTTMKKITRRILSRPEEAQLRVTENSKSLFDAHTVNSSMSRLSRWIKMHSKIQAIVHSRRHNYAVLRDHLSISERILPLHPDLSPTICPWVFPVIFEGISDAHLLLRAQGVPATAWDGVRYPGISAAEFPDAEFLYRNLVFLPIHQCMNEEDVIRMAQTIKNSF